MIKLKVRVLKMNLCSLGGILRNIIFVWARMCAKLGRLVFMGPRLRGPLKIRNRFPACSLRCGGLLAPAPFGRSARLTASSLAHDGRKTVRRRAREGLAFIGQLASLVGLTRACGRKTVLWLGGTGCLPIILNYYFITFTFIKFYNNK